MLGGYEEYHAELKLARETNIEWSHSFMSIKLKPYGNHTQRQ